MHRIVNQRNQPVELYVGEEVHVFEPFGEMKIELTDEGIAEINRVSRGLQLFVEEIPSTADAKAEEGPTIEAETGAEPKAARKTSARRSKSDGV